MQNAREVHAVTRCAAALVPRLRDRAPRVHCITNSVAQNFTANVLLAAGCVPSMTLSPEEIGEFAAGADALLINLGTFDRERREAIGIAIAAAADKGRPWVLDPVLIDRAASRAGFARGLLGQKPAAVRLNAAEFAALADGNAVADFAQMHGCVVAQSGKIDLVTDGSRRAHIANGHQLMARITAMGCAASALVAACVAIEKDCWLATAAALLLLDVAGEMAAETAKGPGSFAVAIVDALYRLDAATLTARAKVT